MAHEFGFIDWIRQRTAVPEMVRMGIGDDAAWVRFPPPGECLITVDMLMEGTDFLLPSPWGQQPVLANPATSSFTPRTSTPEEVGRKSLAVNLSDIAAMAGLPVAAVISVALPRRGGAELGQRLYQGIQPLAQEFQVALVGGDTNTWNGPLVISITVCGIPLPQGPVLRRGAQPGDWILVTGELGGSIQGKHLHFQPRVQEAIALHQAGPLHALIDISDGLAADLGHILEESQVGAILDADLIPIASAAQQPDDGRSPLDHALHDGEDFELVLTAAPDVAQRLLASSLPGNTRLTKIGTITANTDYVLREATGQMLPLSGEGWKHRFT